METTGAKRSIQGQEGGHGTVLDNDSARDCLHGFWFMLRSYVIITMEFTSLPPKLALG